MKNYNRMITVQKQVNDQWTDFYRCHAAINKTSGSERLDSGIIQSQNTLDFDVRYCAKIAEIYTQTQYFRILYNGVPYKITSYDDYLEAHRNIRLTGVSYIVPI